MENKQTAMQIMLTDLQCKQKIYEQSGMYESATSLETSIELANKLIQMENEQRFDNKATRFEVIDHTDKKRGRIVVEYGVYVEISIQDDGQTMKVFLTNNK
jgi:hypothetical protein